MRAPKQPSDVASDVTGDTTPTPKGKTDHRTEQARLSCGVG